MDALATGAGYFFTDTYDSATVFAFVPSRGVLKTARCHVRMPVADLLRMTIHLAYDPATSSISDGGF